MKYADIASINVNDHTERKANLTYLSWAWAVDQLMRLDENAQWEYGQPVKWNDTVMLFCTVTAFGRARTAQLPVMDHRNKPITNPDAFQVNTAMQRCLAKAIALHGLGLYIYAGEDLPMVEGESEPEPEPELNKNGTKKAFKEPHAPARLGFEQLDAETQDYLRSVAADVILLLSKGDDKGAFERIAEEQFDADCKVGLWSLLDSKQRKTLSTMAAAAAQKVTA